MASEPTTGNFIIYFDETAISKIVYNDTYYSYGDTTITSSGSKIPVYNSGYDIYVTVTLNDGYEISSVDSSGIEIELTSENTFTLEAEEIDGVPVTITTKATETSGGGTDMSSVEVAYIQYKDGTKLDAIQINGTKYKFTDYDAVRIDGEETKYKLASSSSYDALSVTPSEIQVENSMGSSGGGSGTITISGGSGSYSVAASSGVSDYFTVLTVSGSTVSYTYYVASTASSNTIYGTITITDTVTGNTIDVDVTCYEYSCLTGDTLITLADGTRKRIDSIEVTDRILSIDPDTGEFVADRIISTDSKEKKLGHHYDKYVFSDGTVITTIHRHRFYNVTQQQMVHLDTWNIGDKAYKQDGTLIELTEKHIKIEEKEQYHYSLFTVHHNYFANGVLCGDRFTRQITKGV